MKARVVLGGVALMWAVAFGHSALRAQATKSVLDGVYTEAQATRGAETYKTACTRCHLATLKGTEKADRNPGSPGDLGERKPAARAQPPKSLTRNLRHIRGSCDQTLLFEHVNDGGGIESAGAAEENGALQETHVGFRIHAVTTLRALRRDETESLPCAQG